jgi:hypothetical protein
VRLSVTGAVVHALKSDGCGADGMYMTAGQQRVIGIHADFDGDDDLVVLLADREVRLRLDVVERVVAAAGDPESLDSAIREHFAALAGPGRRVRRGPSGLRGGRGRPRCNRRSYRRLPARAPARSRIACVRPRPSEGAASEGAVEGPDLPREQLAWALGALIRSALASR